MNDGFFMIFLTILCISAFIALFRIIFSIISWAFLRVSLLFPAGLVEGFKTTAAVVIAIFVILAVISFFF